MPRKIYNREIDPTGERLKEWRLKKELTQGELGDFLNMTSQYISQVENKKRGLSQYSLALLNQAGIDLNWLITGQPVKAEF